MYLYPYFSPRDLTVDALGDVEDASRRCRCKESDFFDAPSVGCQPRDVTVTVTG
jgi:hypothetical protein